MLGEGRGEGEEERGRVGRMKRRGRAGEEEREREGKMKRREGGWGE